MRSWLRWPDIIRRDERSKPWFRCARKTLANISRSLGFHRLVGATNNVEVWHVGGDGRARCFFYALAENLQDVGRWLERPYLFPFSVIGTLATIVLAASTRRHHGRGSFPLVGRTCHVRQRQSIPAGGDRQPRGCHRREPCCGANLSAAEQHPRRIAPRRRTNRDLHFRPGPRTAIAATGNRRTDPLPHLRAGLRGLEQ